MNRRCFARGYPRPRFWSAHRRLNLPLFHVSSETIRVINSPFSSWGWVKDSFFKGTSWRRGVSDCINKFHCTVMRNISSICLCTPPPLRHRLDFPFPISHFPFLSFHADLLWTLWFCKDLILTKGFPYIPFLPLPRRKREMGLEMQQWSPVHPYTVVTACTQTRNQNLISWTSGPSRNPGNIAIGTRVSRACRPVGPIFSTPQRFPCVLERLGRYWFVLRVRGAGNITGELWNGEGESVWI